MTILKKIKRLFVKPKNELSLLVYYNSLMRGEIRLTLFLDRRIACELLYGDRCSLTEARFLEYYFMNILGNDNVGLVSV